MKLVAGAGGFIGGHLVQRFIDQGEQVIAVDIKPAEEWFQAHEDATNIQADMSRRNQCLDVMWNADEIYNLACDMGGIGFIESNKALCMLSVLINTHMLEAARHYDVEKFFYSSSACVYAADKQYSTDMWALREEDAYPAMPEDGYGWEKLFSERMCRHYREDFDIPTWVARFHNIYGPLGSYDGGREKAPAAVCRKIIEAKLSGEHDIEIWGDGNQTRSFCYIDDCVEGIVRLVRSDHYEPINVGSSELVSINKLVDIVEEIAGIHVDRSYKLDAPLGVRGRNSDNTLIQAVLDWQPSTPLKDGMERTYASIWDQMHG